ncbi:MAG: amino acid ABC transporter [Herpetosiphonaceae bacterium]|nr:MAG: amino acid ABC transporter [Herpetosiphonaceae bacterium]
MSAEIEAGTRSDRGRGLSLSFSRAPYWLIILLILFLITFYAILSSETYASALTFIAEGIQLTIAISVAAYAVALIVGLIIGLGRVSKNPIIYTLATLYVEVMRGVPLLVIIFYAQFVIMPWIDDVLAFQKALLRNTFITGVIALALGYAAYLAEVYRAGIESIERGQSEAARSLGMSHFQTMRYIVLPQAVRRVLPALGNDFIAMLKDSSLLSAIGITELTYWGKTKVAASANTFLGWNTVAFLYLILSLLLSLVVKWIERRTSSGRR